MLKKTTLINIVIVFCSICIGLLVCGWGLKAFMRVQNGARATAEKLVLQNPVFQTYTAAEKDFNLPLYTEAQGRACLDVTRKPSGMHYTPYFGWNTQKLDQVCAKEHLSGAGKRVLYFGGSALENFEAPNYLTKVDTYISNLVPNLRSINLAESGGRSTNNLVRIMIEAINLPADYWVFLDGYNEFNSIKYGGHYSEDFYWTAAVYDRIHHPMRSMVDKFIAKSAALEKLFYGTGMLRNPRVRNTAVNEDEIIAAADYYVENQQKISMLCDMKKVKCLFFLQPYNRTEGSSATMLLDKGYARIVERLGDKVIDLRPLFEQHAEFFVDEVHYNKLGSEMIANGIARYLNY